jgi:integrase
MPLTIYRRHLDTCRHADKPRRDAWSQKGQCPIWVQGSLGGAYLRRSLDLVSWEAAQDRVRGWEASGEIDVVKTAILDIADAVERFFEGHESRPVRGHNRQTARAAAKAVSHLPPSPTLPFDDHQMAAILTACDRYSSNGIYGKQNGTRLRALTLLMRYSGLRIGDAVTCARDRVVDSTLFLYQAKTGTPVYCPLPLQRNRSDRWFKSRARNQQYLEFCWAAA